MSDQRTESDQQAIERLQCLRRSLRDTLSGQTDLSDALLQRLRELQAVSTKESDFYAKVLCVVNASDTGKTATMLHLAWHLPTFHLFLRDNNGNGFPRGDPELHSWLTSEDSLLTFGSYRKKYDGGERQLQAGQPKIMDSKEYDKAMYQALVHARITAYLTVLFVKCRCDVALLTIVTFAS